MKTTAFLLCMAHVALSHSTVICTDLDANNQCRGFARNLGKTYYSRGFNQRGNDGYLVGSVAGVSGTKAQNPITERADSRSFPNMFQESYSTELPMAKAQPGQTLSISWPANNHQQANPRGNVPQGTSSPPSAITVNIFKTANGNIAGQQPYTTLSYSNCFAQSSQPFDNRLISGAASATFLCKGDVQMPTQQGKHTFVWEWALGPNTFYYGVFDVQVGDGGSPAPAPGPASPTFAPAPTFGFAPAPTFGIPTAPAAGACPAVGIAFCRDRYGLGCVLRGGRATGGTCAGSPNQSTGTQQLAPQPGAPITGSGAECLPSTVTFCRDRFQRSCAISNGSPTCVVGTSTRFSTAAEDFEPVEIDYTDVPTSDYLLNGAGSQSTKSIFAVIVFVVAVLTNAM